MDLSREIARQKRVFGAQKKNGVSLRKNFLHYFAMAKICRR
jgi:hypothetical protein